ncbi:unnamed protein product [Lathyrus oleraceus]
MGGCATKPKVAKDGEQPEPEQEYQLVKEDIVETKQEPLLQEQRAANLKNVDQVVDDDQANTRRSLSLLFNKENEDAQVTTENEKTKAEETAKHETLEDEPTVKHESPKKEEKLYQESKVNEAAEKQEYAVVVDEVFSLQNQSTDPDKEIVKIQIPEVAKKTSEETIIIEPAKEIVVERNQNTNAAEDEGAKFSTENEKTKAEETVKQETFEDKQPLEDAKIIEPTVKHESPKKEEKLSQETKINEPVTKQESAVVTNEEKPTLQNQIIDSSADVIVKTVTPEEAKINVPVVEETAVKQNQIAIPPEVTVIKTGTPEAEKVSAKTQSNELNEPIKQEKSSETIPIEAVVVSPLNEKVIEVVFPNTESVENKEVETTSSIGEKSHVDAVVEHTPKASDVGSDKVSLS